MCRKLFLLTSLVVVLGLVSSAWAAPDWAGTVSRNWGNDLNWVGQVKPGTGDRPYLGWYPASPAPYEPLISGETITIVNMGVGATSKICTLDMTSGSLTLTGRELMIGNSTWGHGTFNVSAGTVDVVTLSRGARIGRRSVGRLNMTGGTLTTGAFKLGPGSTTEYGVGPLGGRSRIKIYGSALIDVTYVEEAKFALIYDGVPNDASRIHIGGGTLRVDLTGLVSSDIPIAKTDVDAKVDAAIASGVLRAYGYPDTTVVDGVTFSVIKSWDFMGAVLEVTAVPEPAAVALLGLGGLALLRRRR
jgi:hypothetical protein